MKIHFRSCTSGTTRSNAEHAESKKRKYIETLQLPIPSELLKHGYNYEYDNSSYLEAIQQEQDYNPHRESLLHENRKEKVLEEESISEEAKAVTLLKLKLGRLGRATSRKEVNEIINVLSLPTFRLDAFLSSCSSYNDCKLQEDEILQKSLHMIGFKKITLTDPISNICGDMYLRSALEVLRSQIAGVSENLCFFQPTEGKEDFNHPMMAEIGQLGVKSVSKAIMSSVHRDTLWHNGVSAVLSSFVGLIQVYSDKSKTSLKESAFQLYPLHATLLNFHDDYRRKCIVNGSTFLAFLPVSFYKVEEGIKHPANVERPQKLRLLHLAMDTALEEIRQFGYPGFTCKDKEGQRRMCHPCLVSYCCDLPEAKDLSSIRNGNTSERNCHRCLAPSTEFNLFTKCNHRTSKETVGIIQTARIMRNEGKKDEASSLMDDYSLGDQIPSLSKMPFLDLHPTLDMHCCYTFEPLHGFDLGISRDLKRFLSERLRSETLITNNLPTKAGIYKVRTFRSVRMIILNGINGMLSQIQKSSPAKGLRVDFSSTHKGESANGLYGKDGKLIGMLEGKDHRSVDMVLPFMGMFSDRCCGEEISAPCTTVFVKYVEIVQATMSYKNDRQWSHEMIKDLESKIETFKDKARELFAPHLQSRLRTEKFHLLDHIGEDLRRLGGIQFGDAGLYEYAHTLVKKAYKSGSKRRKTAMDETVDLFLKEMNHSALQALFAGKDHINSNETDELCPRAKSARQESINTDCSTLVKRGKRFSLSELIRCRKIMRKLRKAEEMGKGLEVIRFKALLNSMSSTVTEIVQDVGEDGCRVMCAQLLSNTTSETTEHASTVMPSISRVISGYVPGIETPLGNDFNPQKETLTVQSSAVRYSQRMVSGRGFYGLPSLRQDCVVVQADDGSGTSGIVLWVAKVLLMIRIPSSSTSDDEGGDEEYVFVQYYELQPYENAIDEALGCLKLTWAKDESAIGTTTGKCNVDPARKWFDLLPASSIRSVVHVVRGDYGTGGLGITKDIESVPWYEQRFFVNRFYVNNEDRCYNYKGD